jgi:putative membrane protein
MLWLKAFHIVFVISWFAAIFYLPRLFVNHADCQDAAMNQRFKDMERRLFGMLIFAGALALGFGIAMVMAAPAYLEAHWLHAKLALVALIIGHNVWCYRLLVAFREDRNRHSQTWYRVFNEVPVIILIAIVLLVVLKPF